MAHRHQDLIDRINDEKQEPTDNSLQQKALERATGGKVPTTLTPWEWQEWYAEHGVPESHKPSEAEAPRRSWWQRLLGRD